MSVSAYHSVTVGVSDLDAALRLFRDTMQLRVEHEGELSRDWLDAWRLPAAVRARAALLSCRSSPRGMLRLVE